MSATKQTVTEEQAEIWILEHPNNADIWVVIECTQCGDIDGFWDSNLRYGPSGSVHDHNDYCGGCGKSLEFETVKIQMPDGEVIF